MRYAALIAGALLLTACSGGRGEPGGSFFDPLCMPDGSVVHYEYPDKGGKYDEITPNKANCPWNKGRS